MVRSRTVHRLRCAARTLGLLAATCLLMGAHCECPDEAVVPASYQVSAGQLAIDGVDLAFADCSIEGDAGPHFDTSEVPTTLNIQCGTPVPEPSDQPLLRLTVPLGDIRRGADQSIDLSRLNFIAEWSEDGVPVGPSEAGPGSTATVTITSRIGGPASYPQNVTDDFTLEATLAIELSAFTGRGGDRFPGGTMSFTLRQTAADYRLDPGPEPDCL